MFSYLDGEIMENPNYIKHTFDEFKPCPFCGQRVTFDERIFSNGAPHATTHIEKIPSDAVIVKTVTTPTGLTSYRYYRIKYSIKCPTRGYFANILSNCRSYIPFKTLKERWNTRPEDKKNA